MRVMIFPFFDGCASRCITSTSICASFEPSFILTHRFRELPPEATTAPMALLAQPFLTDAQRLLPGANVARIMSRELLVGCKISRDARALMQELATEFICFITSEANDMSLADGRRSITSMDLINACVALDLGEMAEITRAYVDLSSATATSSNPVHPDLGEGIDTDQGASSSEEQSNPSYIAHQVTDLLFQETE